MCDRAFQRQLAWLVLTCLLMVVIGSTSLADVISYSSQVGEDVDFTGIEESSPSGDPLPLFDTPTVSYNSLVFYPTTFSAVSLTGDPAADLTDGRLGFTVSAHAGKTIDSIRMWEMGDYTLAGVGTMDTKAEVGMAVFVTVTKTKQGSITPVTFNQQMVFSPKADGDFNLVDDAGVARIWEGETMLDIAAVVKDATEVSIVLDNTLLATSEAASVAMIAKKMVGVDVDIPVVPEPSTLLLLALGGVGILVGGRRRA